MTQPQALQAPRLFPSVSPEAMTAAADDVQHFAAAFELYNSNLQHVHSVNLYVWSEQLAAASRRLEALARNLEAQGK